MNKEKARYDNKKRLGFVPLLLLVALSLAFSSSGFSQPKSDFSSKFALAKCSGTSIRISNQIVPASIVEKSIEDRSDRSSMTEEFASHQYFARLIRPPSNGARVLSELVIGFGAGVGLTIAVAGILKTDDLEGGVAALLCAYPIGVTLGVYLIGTIGNETGSFLATFLGSMAGIALAIPAAISISNDDLKGIPLLLGPPLGACIGFNATRRYKDIYTPCALLNYKEGQISLAMPQVRFQPNPFGRKSLSLNLYLLNVNL